MNPLHKSLSQARELTKAAYKDYYALKKKAHKLRGTYLDKKAEALAESKDTSKASILKQMKHREEQRVSSPGHMPYTEQTQRWRSNQN